MKSMSCPCEDCFERACNCHSTCERYKEWVIWHEKDKQRQKDFNGIIRPTQAKIYKPDNNYSPKWIKYKYL